MAKVNNVELKNPTTNYERKILGIIEDARKDLEYGRISLEIVITNKKIVLVELESTKKTFKLDK